MTPAHQHPCILYRYAQHLRLQFCRGGPELAAASMNGRETRVKGPGYSGVGRGPPEPPGAFLGC